MSLGERIVFYAVTFPFGLGVTASLLRRLRFAAFGIALLVISLPVKSLMPYSGSLDSAQRQLILEAMTISWLIIGVYVGTQVQRYLWRIGPSGYFFKFALTLTTISLSAIVVDRGTDLLHRRELAEVRRLAGGYLYLVLVGLVLLSLLDWHSILLGVRNAWKDLLVTFTFFGLVTYFANAWLEKFLSDVLWWAPQTKPPLAYEWIFAVIFGLAAAFRPRILGGSTTKRLDPIRFKYVAPNGWAAETRMTDKTQNAVYIMPGRSLLGMVRPRARLELVIVTYAGSDPSDPVELGRTTQKYLLAPNARILEITFSFRHGPGPLSFEAVYRQGPYLGFFISSVVDGKHYIVRCLKRGSSGLPQDIQMVVQFVNNLAIEPKVS